MSEDPLPHYIVLTGDDILTLTSSSCVCVSSVAQKLVQISISLSSTLNELRDAISTNDILGPIQRSEQRLFYLGRELKTGNRTLSTLGIGNHNIFVMHLHSLAPKVVDLQYDDNNDDIGQKKKSGEVAALRGKSNGNRQNAGHGSEAEATGTSRTRRQQKKVKDNVVDLLDSDSEDGDNDAVEVIEAAPKRRRRG